MYDTMQVGKEPTKLLQLHDWAARCTCSPKWAPIISGRQHVSGSRIEFVHVDEMYYKRCEMQYKILGKTVSKKIIST